jgi:hypothetical protein
MRLPKPFRYTQFLFPVATPLIRELPHTPSPGYFWRKVLRRKQMTQDQRKFCVYFSLERSDGANFEDGESHDLRITNGTG